MSVRAVHGIVCSRIILNLRQAASSGDASPTLSTGLIFAASPWLRTNPADTVSVEMGSTHNDNEPELRKQTDENFAVGKGVALEYPL